MTPPPTHTHTQRSNPLSPGQPDSTKPSNQLGPKTNWTNKRKPGTEGQLGKERSCSLFPFLRIFFLGGLIFLLLLSLHLLCHCCPLWGTAQSPSLQKRGAALKDRSSQPTGREFTFKHSSRISESERVREVQQRPRKNEDRRKWGGKGTEV